MVFINTSIISDGPIKLEITKLGSEKNVCRLRHLSSKKWSNLNYPLLTLVSHIEFDIYQVQGSFQ